MPQKSYAELIPECPSVQTDPNPIYKGIKQDMTITMNFGDSFLNDPNAQALYTISASQGINKYLYLVEDNEDNNDFKKIDSNGDGNIDTFTAIIKPSGYFNISLEIGDLTIKLSKWSERSRALPGDTINICETKVFVSSPPREDPATPKSCPLCPDGAYWDSTENKCGIGVPVVYVPSIRRVDCSAEGTTCNAGKGYCSNPGPPQACRDYKKEKVRGSICDASLKDPGDCADGLVCQDESSKCVRAQAGLGNVCYKCRAEYAWNGQYCADSSNNTCIAPESRAYCAEGSSCTQGKGCQKNTEQPPAEQEKLTPLKTPCEKSLSGTVEDGVECTGVFSGLGRLPTDPLELIPKILEVILGVAGGIVVLLIIRTGYKLMFSQGNPEKVQEAKDELTSAIVGLLFIIFSFVLLQFITNDLLKIQDLPIGEGIKAE